MRRIALMPLAVGLILLPSSADARPLPHPRNRGWGAPKDHPPTVRPIRSFGVYRARVVFPADGSWVVGWESFEEPDRIEVVCGIRTSNQRRETS